MGAISYSYVILDERTKISSAAEDYKHDLQFGCVSLVHLFPHIAYIDFSMISIRPANHLGEDCLRIHFIMIFSLVVGWSPQQRMDWGRCSIGVVFLA